MTKFDLAISIIMGSMTPQERNLITSELEDHKEKETGNWARIDGYSFRGENLVYDWVENALSEYTGEEFNEFFNAILSGNNPYICLDNNYNLHITLVAI